MHCLLGSAGITDPSYSKATAELAAICEHISCVSRSPLMMQREIRFAGAEVPAGGARSGSGFW